MSFRGDLLINFYMSQEKNIKTRIWPSHVHGSVQMSCILYLCILGYLYIYNHKTLNGSTHICNQNLIMLRYRFGFPGIFFLFNVWWGAKSNWQNGKYKIFCNRNQVHQFQVLELLLDQDTGQTCGKLRWEVSLIRGGIIWRLSFYQTHYLTSQVPLIRHVIRSPSFFSHHASYLTLNPCSMSSMTRQPFHFSQFQPRFLLFQEDVLSACQPFKSCVILAQFLKSLNVNRKM